MGRKSGRPKSECASGACLPSPLDPKDGDIFGLFEERGAAWLPLGRLVLPFPLFSFSPDCCIPDNCRAFSNTKRPPQDSLPAAASENPVVYCAFFRLKYRTETRISAATTAAENTMICNQ